MRAAVPGRDDRHQRVDDHPPDAAHQPDGWSEAPSWRVPRAVPVLKIAGAAALAGLTALFALDARTLLPGAAAALVLLLWGVRDLVVPVRLSADADGVTVPRGLTGRRTVAWAEIEDITVDARSRYGLRSESLEIDAGEALYLFSRYDLGAEPHQVAAQLRQLAACR